MQDFGVAASSLVAQGRAEIKDRLLSSAPVSGPPVPAAEQSQLFDNSAAGGDEASAAYPDDVQWIEPVFVEPIAGEDSTEKELQTGTVGDRAEGPASVPAQDAAVPVDVAHAEARGALRTTPRPSWPRWGRRSSALPEPVSGAAKRPKKIATERDGVADEIAALRHTLAADRSAAAEEIAALRIALTAEREAAADEIAALRNTLTAEREAAAGEIAMLRTVLAAQQEAAAARAGRLKEALGATISPAAASN